MHNAIPRIVVFSTGGTIASQAGSTGAAVPRLSGAELVEGLPGVEAIAEVHPVAFRQSPSADLRLEDLVQLVAQVRQYVRLGFAAAVVTHGTDSMEESAFALDLLWDGEEPIVLTGAMRNADSPGADGPANLLAAIRVAIAGATTGLGCLVVMNDEIHAARFVQKKNTASPAAFVSPLCGPVGWISEGRIRLVVRPVGRHHVACANGPVPRVALLKVGLGDDGRLLRSVARFGFEGLVVEGMGGGHVPQSMVEELGRLAEKMAVVLASRTGSGNLLTGTYGYPGSETDLLSRGLVSAGVLDGLKARILLTMLLMHRASRAAISDAFQRVGCPGSGDLWLAATSRQKVIRSS